MVSNIMKKIWMALLVLFATAPAYLSADVLLMESMSNVPPNTEAGVLRPDNGMTMTQVEQKFGMPTEKIAAVGEPPIARWVYPEFTVYFEHNLVLTSVVKR